MKPDSVCTVMIRTGWLAAFLAMPILPAAGFDLDSGAAPVPTVIDSDSLEMRGTEERNTFYFRDNVRVRGEHVEIECDELVVVSAREGSPDSTIGEIGAIERIIATGDVRIRQAGREARAGRAVMDPREGSVVLSDDPRIVDGATQVTGWQIILSRDRSVRVLQDPSDPVAGRERRRATVILGEQLPDLRFDREPDPQPPEDENERATDPDPEDADGGDSPAP